MEIPKGHNVIMPYLILKDAEGFISFTKTVFNADLTHKAMRDNTDVIMHAEILIDGSTVMFGQTTEQYTEATANLFIYVANADETYKAALSHGATSVMDLSDQSYGRTCGVKDAYGNVWWITSV